MPFLKLSNADVSFGKETLIWRSYTTNKALLNIKQARIIDQTDFTIVVLDADNKMFIVYVVI